MWVREGLLQQSGEELEHAEPLVSGFTLCCCGGKRDNLLHSGPARCSVVSSSERQQEVPTAEERM